MFKEADERNWSLALEGARDLGLGSKVQNLPEGRTDIRSRF